jgi:hypothetical protein
LGFYGMFSRQIYEQIDLRKEAEKEIQFIVRKLCLIMRGFNPFMVVFLFKRMLLLWWIWLLKKYLRFVMSHPLLTGTCRWKITLCYRKNWDVDPNFIENNKSLFLTHKKIRLKRYYKIPSHSSMSTLKVMKISLFILLAYYL